MLLVAAKNTSAVLWYTDGYDPDVFSLPFLLENNSVEQLEHCVAATQQNTELHSITIPI